MKLGKKSGDLLEKMKQTDNYYKLKCSKDCTTIIIYAKAFKQTWQSWMFTSDDKCGQHKQGSLHKPLIFCHGL